MINYISYMSRIKKILSSQPENTLMNLIQTENTLMNLIHKQLSGFNNLNIKLLVFLLQTSGNHCRKHNMINWIFDPPLGLQFNQMMYFLINYHFASIVSGIFIIRKLNNFSIWCLKICPSWKG